MFSASVLFEDQSLALVSEDGVLEFFPEIGKPALHCIEQFAKAKYFLSADNLAQVVYTEYCARQLLAYIPHLETICLLDFSNGEYHLDEMVEERSLQSTRLSKESEDLVWTDLHYNASLHCMYLIQGIYNKEADMIEHALYRYRIPPSQQQARNKFTKVIRTEGVTRPFVHTCKHGFAFGMLRFDKVDVRVDLPQIGSFMFSVR